jgi:plasmid stabilization system protein ParE
VGGRRKLKWAAQAARDFERAHAYWAEQSSKVGVRFAATVLATIRAIKKAPDLGSPALDLAPTGRYRGRLAGPLYRVIYRVDPEVIWIVRIWDTRRDPEGLVVDDLPGE